LSSEKGNFKGQLQLREKLFMHRIRKFMELSWPDKLLLIYAILALAMVALGLRILGWLDLQHLLLKLGNWSSRFVLTQRPSVQKIARAIRIASRYVPKATCLPQALAAQLLLTQNGYPANLQIGVAKNKEGVLEAHAWVRSENSIVIGGVQSLDHFVSLSPMETKP
jgi:hypothetical protein